MVSCKAFDTEAFLTTVGGGRTSSTVKPMAGCRQTRALDSQAFWAVKDTETCSAILAKRKGYRFVCQPRLALNGLL